MPEHWIDFHLALEIIARHLGSKELAWTEIYNRLKSGELKSIAERSEIYDLTGEVLRKMMSF